MIGPVPEGTVHDCAIELAWNQRTTMPREAATAVPWALTCVETTRKARPLQPTVGVRVVPVAPA